LSTTRFDDALLLARTVRHLRPAQVVHRARLRSQKVVLARWPAPFERRWRQDRAGVSGWPDGFHPLDAEDPPGAQDPDDLAQGRFRFLTQSRELGDPPDWEHAGAEQLWRYHLHYFEWAWGLAAHQDRVWARERFGVLWRSWRDSTTFGRWDAWSPYVVSLRAWALCGLYGPLIRGTEAERAFNADMALHARFLKANLEFDVGGNHLVKNLKALIGLTVFIGDDRLEHAAARHLARQLSVQVLADGGHFERSPSYHCQVLGDLLDIQALRSAARLPAVAGLDGAINSMQRWLGAMLMPDGDVPLFNDCTLVGADRLRLLAPPAEQQPRLQVLPESGYVICRPSDQVHLVIDVGPPCPLELPAHAHADCLSFELAVHGKRVIVDTGTSTYAPGPVRAHERSTRAHNTVEVDGTNQTEVWGAFRAARRAVPWLHKAVDDDTTITVVASHGGYERLPGRPRHRRTVELGSAGVTITDQVTGRGRHEVVARCHVPADVTLAAGSDAPDRPGMLAVAASAARGPNVGVELPVVWGDALVATGFGERERSRVATMGVTDELPVILRTSLRWCPERSPMASSERVTTEATA